MGPGAQHTYTMIAALILTISFVTLLQFFVSYSHSLIADARGYELSEQAREIASVTAPTVRGDDFKRLLQLIAVCPESGSDNTRVRTVSVYFSLLGISRKLFGSIMPAVAKWIESERGGCAYVMPVVLDRRIAHSQALMAQQSGIQM